MTFEDKKLQCENAIVENGCEIAKAKLRLQFNQLDDNQRSNLKRVIESATESIVYWAIRLNGLTDDDWAPLNCLPDMD